MGYPYFWKHLNTSVWVCCVFFLGGKNWDIFLPKSRISCHIISLHDFGWIQGDYPPQKKTNMTGWEHPPWMSPWISYWKWWIFQPVMLVFRGLNCSIRTRSAFETRRPRVAPNSLVGWNPPWKGSLPWHRPLCPATAITSALSRCGFLWNRGMVCLLWGWYLLMVKTGKTSWLNRLIWFVYIYIHIYIYDIHIPYTNT